MKIILALISALTMACVASAQSTNSSVVLTWQYPASDITTDLVFKVYTTLNPTQALSGWTVVTTVPTPIPVVSSNGLATISNRFAVVPGLHFYSLTASNFWGESPPSNIAGTPPPPRVPTNIQLGP